jgi:hypothetical protein
VATFAQRTETKVVYCNAEQLGADWRAVHSWKRAHCSLPGHRGGG